MKLTKQEIKKFKGRTVRVIYKEEYSGTLTTAGKKYVRIDKSCGRNRHSGVVLPIDKIEVLYEKEM